MTSKFNMRLYLLGIRLARTKCCLVLVVFGFFLILGRLYQYRRHHHIIYSMLSLNGVGGDYPNSLTGEGGAGNNLSKSGYFVPGLFLNGQPWNDMSYCQLNYGLPGGFNPSEDDVHYSPELGEDGQYRIVYNVLDAQINSTFLTNNVTYCTHATPQFLYFLAEILKRWEGPVSVATFVPATDATATVCLLERLCSCLPDMSRVSLHFVYPVRHPPIIGPCPLTLSSSPSGGNNNSCSVPEVIAERTLSTFRESQALIYPVNVARNAARVQAQTKYTMVSDVELFPSRHLVGNFLRMMSNLGVGRSSSGKSPGNRVAAGGGYYSASTSRRIVYVVPVFEVATSEPTPAVKSKLLAVYAQNRAFYFHRLVCNHCQRFPGLQRWLASKIGDDEVQPFFVVRREFPFHRWEPVFIGTNQEPLYSEWLSWEGQQDKMTQMHEMCLLKYHFVILDGAFLVHAPGVKKKTDIVRDNWRNYQQRKNSFNYELIIKKLNQRVSDNSRCRVH